MAATGNTTIQLAVPDHLRGRVMSVYTTAFTASVPIGGLAFGAAGVRFGRPVAIGVGGVLTFIVGLGALAWGRRARSLDRRATLAAASPAQARPEVPPPLTRHGRPAAATRSALRPHRGRARR